MCVGHGDVGPAVDLILSVLILFKTPASLKKGDHEVTVCKRVAYDITICQCATFKDVRKFKNNLSLFRQRFEVLTAPIVSLA